MNNLTSEQEIKLLSDRREELSFKLIEASRKESLQIESELDTIEKRLEELTGA